MMNDETVGQPDDGDPNRITVNAETVLRILQVKAGTDPLLRAQLEAAVWEAAYMGKGMA